MSSRPLFTPHTVVDAGDMSADIISDPTIITNLSMFSYAISWAGTAPVGTMSVQVSNDYSQNAAGKVMNAGTWTTVTLSAPTPVTGATGNGFIDIDATAAYAIRAVYTATSGTGELTVVAVGKVQ